MKLGDISEIRSGYTFRNRDDFSNGPTVLVQAKDLPDLQKSNLQRIEFTNQNHLLALGDVLLSIKGSFRASAYYKNLGDAVASSSLVVLRPRDDLDPKYLVTFLNSSQGQTALKQIALGAYLPSLTIARLRDLSVPLPPPGKQKAIVLLRENVAQQKAALQVKQRLLEKTFNAALNHTIKEHER